MARERRRPYRGEATGGGGGGAPTGASYVTLATNGDLTHERVLTAGTAITVTDGGAGSTVTVGVTDGSIDTTQLADGAVTAAKMSDRLPPGYITGLYHSNERATNPLYQTRIETGKCRDASDTVDIEVSSALTADLTVSGANGLDTGSEATDTWYYLWVIAKADGTVASLLSTSSTAPTMPTDYVYKRRLSARYNDSSGDIKSAYGPPATGWTYHHLNQIYFNGATGTSVFTPTVADNLPPTAVRAALNIELAKSGTTFQTLRLWTVVADAGTAGRESMVTTSQGASYERNRTFGDVDLPEGPNGIRMQSTINDDATLQFLGWWEAI